jgi:glycosyltransferase involved in cell wall biosynthesis
MTEKIKVCFIIPTLTQGGAERVLVTLIKHLDRSKFQISLMVVNMHEQMYLKEIPSDVNIIDLKSKHVRTALPKVIINLWKLKPDKVMSTIGYLNLAIGMVRFLMPKNIAFFARETIVVSERIKRVRFPRVWRFWYTYYYPRFNKVICQSMDMLVDLCDIVGNDRNLVLINNPVDRHAIRNLAAIKSFDSTDFFKDKSKIYFVAAGRLIDQKGFDLLVRAVAIASEPRIKLAILGHGPLEQELLTLIEKFSLEDNVFLVGYQENPYSWISQADAFILSSLYEGFPNVLLEALACQTNLISTPAPGGTKEILDQVSGCFLAEQISADALATSMSLFIHTERINIQESAIDIYDVQNIVQQYEEVFLGSRENVK